MNWIVPVLMILSTAVMMYGTAQSAKNAKDMSEYNALVAAREAEERQKTADAAAKQKRREGEKLNARQRALYGHAGVSLESGSPLLIMEETAAQTELDALMIEREGLTGYQRGMSEAGLSRMEGKARYRAGMTQAGGSLLSGAAKAYGYGGTKKPDA